MEIPYSGRTKEEISILLDNYKKENINFRNGKSWSLSYYVDEEHEKFINKVCAEFEGTNLLNPIAYKGIKKMEHEIIRMTANLFHGDENAVGTITSGGTESILAAVATYKRIFRKRIRKQQIKLKIKRKEPAKPEMIIPESAHPVFFKAARYFNIKLIIAPVDKRKQVNAAKVERLINENTMLIVGSAPSYPFGSIDPIVDLGELAAAYKVPLHVDACIGGYLFPFIEKAGIDLPMWDFRVRGVTSISADLHKYGYSAKGASVIVYKNMNYLKNQFYVNSNWSGGLYVSAGISGTRSGAPIASAFATIKHLGQEGYVKLAKDILTTTAKLQSGIQSIHELQIIGAPQASVFAYNSISDKVNIYAVADQMEKKGWHIDRQQKPESIHITVSPIHKNVADAYLTDLRESIEFILQNPECNNQGSAALYAMLAKLPVRKLINIELLNMMKKMYGPKGIIEDFKPSGQDIKTFVADKVIKLKDKFDFLKDKLKDRIKDL